MQGDKIKVKAKTTWGEIAEVEGWPLDSGLCIVQQITSSRFTILHHKTGLGIVHDIPDLARAMKLGTWLAEQRDDWDDPIAIVPTLRKMLVEFPGTRESPGLHHPDRTPINDPLEGRILDGL